MTAFIGRREFITLLGGAAAAWPLVARAQQPAMPLIGFLESASPDARAPYVDAFLRAWESGFVEGQNVMIEYRSAEGRPIDCRSWRPTWFAVRWPSWSRLHGVGARGQASYLDHSDRVLAGGDPVELGLVGSLNRPGGNVTGVNFLVNELVAKRLELLRELVPGTTTLGISSTRTIQMRRLTRKMSQAAGTMRGALLIVRAGTRNELDAAFAALARERPDGLRCR